MNQLINNLNGTTEIVKSNLFFQNFRKGAKSILKRACACAKLNSFRNGKYHPIFQIILYDDGERFGTKT
jgi:hypothetical protein